MAAILGNPQELEPDDDSEMMNDGFNYRVQLKSDPSRVAFFVLAATHLREKMAVPAL